MRPNSDSSFRTSDKGNFRAMRIRLAGYLAIGCALGIISPGCSLCPTAFDYDYGGYSSTTPRSDMRNGRVGSIFSDPELGGTPQSSEVIADGQSGFAMESEYAEEIIMNDFQESQVGDIQTIEIGPGEEMVDGIEIVSP